jgi:hypothetical protein
VRNLAYFRAAQAMWTALQQETKRVRGGRGRRGRRLSVNVSRSHFAIDDGGRDVVPETTAVQPRMDLVTEQVGSHELESLDGIALVSRANQAAA